MSVSYHDLLGCSTAPAARQLLSGAQLVRGREAVELVGARRAQEFCPPGCWDEPIAAGAVLQAWRARVIERAFLRWESHSRAVLVQDALEQAGSALEARAKVAGVRLGREGREVLRDALSGSGE